VRRFDQRQGFLVSAAIHLTLLMILIAHPPSARREPELDPRTLEKKDLVFLPPASVIRQLVPKTLVPAQPAPRPPAPAPRPTPPPTAGKDRISVGPPSELRSKGPIILHRDDDLTKAPKGVPSPPPRAATPPPPVATPPPAETAVAQQGSKASEIAGREGLRLPPGLLGTTPRGDEGVRSRPGMLGPSIASAVDGAVRQLDRDAQLGIPTGNGQNNAGFHFDPQGADFTLWLSQAKDEIYRNWVIPQTALLGFYGDVEFHVVIERDGSISSLQMARSSGTSSLDRAAQHALEGSRFLPLPDDYRPRRLPMAMTFVYGRPRS
jgi:TonB family protein